MSTKLVRYKDVCNAVIPMIADMMQRGDIGPAIDTLKALGALEDIDPAKEIKERCKAKDDCASCKYYRDIDGDKRCILICNGMTPEV